MVMSAFVPCMYVFACPKEKCIPVDMLLELARREKNSGIKPDEDIDLFMKVLILSF